MCIFKNNSRGSRSRRNENIKEALMGGAGEAAGSGAANPITRWLAGGYPHYGGGRRGRESDIVRSNTSSKSSLFGNYFFALFERGETKYGHNSTP